MNSGTMMPSDVAALLGKVDPDVSTAAAYSTDWGDASKFEAFLGVVSAGTLGTSATVDAKFEQATDSGGTGVKDVTGSDITQLTEAGTDSDKQVFVQCRRENLDIDGGFDFIRLTVTVAVATSDLDAELWGFFPRNGPASDNDLASVDQILTVP